MKNIRLYPAFLFSLLLVAACATPDASSPMRGAPCDKIGEIATERNTLFVCNEAPTGSVSHGVWGFAGIDKPITTKGTPNTNCSQTGELGVAEDGSIVLCSWNKIDLPDNNGGGNDHVH